MKYRIELDGLRAIAVMSVILYHAGISQIGAGYAGVDVFFVISGFLIGGQIAKDLAKGTFTYWDFYARRVRRILPALLLVIICSATASSFIMVPQEFRYFGGGALSEKRRRGELLRLLPEKLRDRVIWDIGGDQKHDAII